MSKNYIVIVSILFFAVGCARLPSGKNIPTNVSGVDFKIKQFDGSLMNQPLGTIRINGSNFMFWKYRQNASNVSMIFGPLGALAGSSYQSNLNSKLINSQTDNFDQINFKKITDKIIHKKYQSKVVELLKQSDKPAVAEFSTYCRIEHVKEEEVVATYITEAVITLDGKKIWKSLYTTPSKYTTLAALSSSALKLEDDVSVALEKNLAAFFYDIDNRTIALQ